MSTWFARGLPVWLAGWVAVLATAAPFEQGRLFRLERAGIPASYVYGTMHSDDPRAVELPGAVRTALADSRSVAFEAVLTDRDRATFFELAQYTDARRLTDQVSAAELAEITGQLGTRVPSTEALVRLKPWAVLLMLAQPATGTGPTLEQWLEGEARRLRMQVLSLELPDEQVAALDALPLQSQLALMRWAIAQRTRHAADHERAMAAWLAGDLARLHALALAPGKRDRSLAPHFRALMRHLVVDRNALFAHRLHLPLARGRVFVAVGALHLHGPQGLLAALAGQGYRVVRVLRGRGRTQRKR